MNDYFARVYPPPAWDGDIAQPLVDGEPPVIPDAPPAAPRWPTVRSMLAVLWYLIHISVYGACVITLLRYSLEQAEYVAHWQQALPIGGTVALALWGITLMVWRWSHGRT